MLSINFIIMTLENMFHFIRKLLFEIIFYFLLQGILFLILALVILLYPYALNVLMALGLVIGALISIYIMIRVAILFHKAKKLMNVISK